MSNLGNKSGDLTSSTTTPLEIPPSLDSALRASGIDTRDPNVTRAIGISLTMMFSGVLPLAPPPILKEYQNIRPDLVDKLIEWTETQAGHRRDIEKTKAERTEDRLDRGQWIAATVALGGLVLATIVGIFGNAYVAGVMAIAAIGGPTTTVWLARNIRSQQQQPQIPSPPQPPKNG